MINMKRILFIFSALTLFIFKAYSQPTLQTNGTTAHIIANGKPMLIIGGEMGNSSASSAADIKKHFDHLQRLGLNTVLVPVSWELIEPEEGKFDMSSLDNILIQAQSHDLKVVLLWFGAWKNSMSCYAPEWFKRDVKRFPRAHAENGRPVEEASSLSQNVLEADKKAFCKVIEYLRDNDKSQTVIMVQVENEIGMIDVPRDYSEDANKLYHSRVPESLVKYLTDHRKTLHPYMAERFQYDSTHKTWPEVFGNDIYSEEIFQTWTYARYVEQLASAGKEIYKIPMYVNVALNSRGRKPGQYPSGGPLAHLIDIWHASAPSIQVLGVDIYDAGFADWTDKYHLQNNPLFIPEIRLEDKDAMYALYAFGHHDAMGFCPFSIEDYPMHQGKSTNSSDNIDLNADDQLNAFTPQTGNLSPIVSCYRLLRQAEQLIIDRQGTSDMDAVLLTNEHREQEIITTDGIRFTVKHSYSLGWEAGAKDENWPEAACIILRLGEEDYMVLGSGVVITCSDAKAGTQWKKGDKRIGIALCESVSVEGRLLTPVRRLNGDQTHQGRHIRIPAGQFDAQHFRLYRF